MAQTNIRPGFGYRFRPTEEQIIKFLESKLRYGTNHHLIKTLDIRNFQPRQLAQECSPPLNAEDQEWYFCTPITYRNEDRQQINRSTATGHWTVTGSTRQIPDGKGTGIGTRIPLVFEQGHGSNGRVRTEWIIDEFHSKMETNYQERFVICRLKRKQA